MPSRRKRSGQFGPMDSDDPDVDLEDEDAPVGAEREVVREEVHTMVLPPPPPPPPAPVPRETLTGDALSTAIIARLRTLNRREQQGLLSWAQRTQGGTKGGLTDVVQLLLGE